MAESDVINNKSYQLKSLMNELSKSKQILDGQGRLEFLYQAPVDAKDGDPCVVVQYSYYGSSYEVDYVKESHGTWQTAFESF